MSDTNPNMIISTIETNRELSAIMSNFSDDFIANMVQDALQWKFRPYSTPMPNVPYNLETQFNAVINAYDGPPDIIKQRREEVYLMIINVICQTHGLQLQTDISYEHLYPLCYVMYQIFISEFTDIMIRFFSDYINNHTEYIISGLTEEQKTQKSTYTKRVYTDPNQIIMYENMEAAMDMVASLDIQFENLLPMITDQNTTNLILTYIADVGDFYKNYYASYVRNPFTKTDMLTSIKTRFMDQTVALIQQQQIIKEE